MALRATLGRTSVTARGRESRHCRRLRDVTPQRLVCALVEALGASRVETIADILRTFNAQTGLRTQYKAFYNRLAQPQFPRFMRQIYRDILRNLSANILRPAADGKLAHFQDVVVQDGSSFAVHDALAQTFGGRFTTIRPAAVELHTFLSVFHDQVIDVEVAPDKEAERQFLPPADTLPGKLLLADRGYESLDYWAAVQAAGGFFLMRGTTDLNPRIRTVRGPHGALSRFAGRRLQDVLRVLPRRRLDLDVEWDRPGGQTLRLRLVLIWTRPERAYTVLVYQRPPERPDHAPGRDVVSAAVADRTRLQGMEVLRQSACLHQRQPRDRRGADLGQPLRGRVEALARPRRAAEPHDHSHLHSHRGDVWGPHPPPALALGPDRVSASRGPRARHSALSLGQRGSSASPTRPRPWPHALRARLRRCQGLSTKL